LGLVVLPVAGAEAAPVTVGSPLTKTFGGTLGSSPTGTWANSVLTEAGANVTSPVDGAIVAWTMAGNYSKGKPFELRVLRPAGPGVYTAVGTSAPGTPTGGTQTFTTDLPIEAGDLIGLNVNEGYIGTAGVTGGDVIDWFPELAEGATLAPPYGGENVELGFNATVQPAPTITAITPGSGVSTGGTAVTISGTDFEGAGAVKFGSAAASSFTVSSEGQIDAIAPAGAGSVPVTVTTIAGTATSPQNFTYAAPAATCTVPKLKGKTLKAAKKRIRAAHCRVGKVIKKAGATAKHGTVVKQAPKASAVVPAATKVKVTLAP